MVMNENKPDCGARPIDEMRRNRFSVYISLLWFSVLFCTFFSAGCHTRLVSRSEPKYQFIARDDYYISITPVRSQEHISAFRLIVKNNTPQDIEIDWNRTYYLVGEDPHGGFMFDGIEYKDREERKPPDLVYANDLFIKTLWPNELVGRNKDWYHNRMEDGTHGIEITLIVRGISVQETLMLSIAIVGEDDS